MPTLSNINNNKKKQLNTKIFTVLVNFNGHEDTIECLSSLCQLDYKNNQIFVVDNSSSSDSIQKIINWTIKQQHNYSFISEDDFLYNEVKSSIVLIKSNSNKGFAAANNIVLKYFLKFANKTDYCWILNNDTVVNKDIIHHFLKYFQSEKKENLGILGATLVYYDNPKIIQGLGGSFNEFLLISKHVLEGKSLESVANKHYKIDYVIGASMFISYSFLNTVGLMNEVFFLYFEELDWAKRAKNKGFAIDYCETALVFHKEGKSIGSSYQASKKSFFSEITLFKSRKKFIELHYNKGFRFYFSSVLLIFSKLIKGKFKLSYSLIKITFAS